MYTVEKRTVTRSGELVNVWNQHGCNFGKVKKKGVWCVMKGGCIFAEARGKAKAELISKALNKLKI